MAAIILMSVLVVLAMAGTVQSDIKCQGNNGGLHDRVSQEAVKASFEQLMLSIEPRSYQNGVSFTKGVNLTTSCNHTVVTRLMYWDNDTCTPGTKFDNNTQISTFFNDFLSLWKGGQEIPVNVSSWGMLVRENYIVDYYTVSSQHQKQQQLEHPSKEPVGASLYCSGERYKHNCNPRKSNLISGNNGAFNILHSGESLVSPNSLFRFEMQEDCNLVLYKNVSSLLTAVWQSGTRTRREGSNCYVVLQPDLNLVLFTFIDSEWKALWQSYPSSKLATRNMTLVSSPATGVLTMQNDGNVVIYATDNFVDPIWATNTNGY